MNLSSYFLISFKMSIRSIRFPLVYKIAITWLITPISQKRLIFRPYDQDFRNRAKILHQMGPKNVHSHKIPTSLLKPYTVHITNNCFVYFDKIKWSHYENCWKCILFLFHYYSYISLILLKWMKCWNVEILKWMNIYIATFLFRISGGNLIILMY